MTTNMETSIMGDWVKSLLDDIPQPANCNGTDWQEREKRSTVRRAIALRHEVETFEARWPEPKPEEALVPAFSWAQLERQIADLTDTPLKAAMARDLVSATRKMARFKPAEMVLREILCLTWALLDEGFQPQPSSGSEEGSADMP
jgi:hypothetical protein